MNRPSRSMGRMRRVSGNHTSRQIADPLELSRTWQVYKETGVDDARNRLIEHYLYLVKFHAERVGAKVPDEVEVDDLMSAGIFGLVDAIDSFDLTRGVKFETFCPPRIRGAILDELRRMDWVPRLVRQRAHKLAEATRSLEVELGRVPNHDEIAGKMTLSREDFEKLLRDATAVSQVSLSRKSTETDSDRDVFELDVVPDERNADPITEAQKREIRDLLTRGLDRAQQLIIMLYYFEEMTMREIGRALDLSESRVSQMHSAIIQQLKDRLQQTAPQRLSVMA